MDERNEAYHSVSKNKKCQPEIWAMNRTNHEDLGHQTHGDFVICNLTMVASHRFRSYMRLFLSIKLRWRAAGLTWQLDQVWPSTRIRIYSCRFNKWWSRSPPCWAHQFYLGWTWNSLATGRMKLGGSGRIWSILESSPFGPLLGGWIHLFFCLDTGEFDRHNNI